MYNGSMFGNVRSRLFCSKVVAVHALGNLAWGSLRFLRVSPFECEGASCASCVIKGSLAKIAAWYLALAALFERSTHVV